jgi:mannan endo-1,4-beta-mannosidase
VTGRTRASATLVATAVVVLVAGAILAASLRHNHEQDAAAATRPTTSTSTPAPRAVQEPKVVRASLPTTGSSYLGVYDGSNLTTEQYGQVEQFADAAGRQPNIVLYYSGWGEGFSGPYAELAFQHGATLLVDMDPTSTSCAAIAAGQQDAYLSSYAESVKAFGRPVIISFGHEMNGTWYSWGWTNTQPAVFVQAWQHIVDVFRQVGADNVTWLWTVNSVNQGEGPITDYWPGADYVTWVGIDAYYYDQTDDFDSVFMPTVSALRQITSKPILIAETAVGQVAGQAEKIPGLFAGVADSGLLGLVWYDQNDEAEGGPYKQDWQLEGHPQAIAAFQAAAAQYLAQPAASTASPPGR